MKTAALPARLMPPTNSISLRVSCKRQAHRRLVKDDQVGLEIERADNGDALLFAAGKILNHGIGRDRAGREAHRLDHEAVGFGAHFLDIEKAKAIGDFAPHEDIAPERVLIGKGAFLIDGFDAEFARFGDGQMIDLFAR